MVAKMIRRIAGMNKAEWLLDSRSCRNRVSGWKILAILNVGKNFGSQFREGTTRECQMLLSELIIQLITIPIAPYRHATGVSLTSIISSLGLRDGEILWRRADT
jgi:hypothetical protein